MSRKSTLDSRVSSPINVHRRVNQPQRSSRHRRSPPLFRRAPVDAVDQQRQLRRGQRQRLARLDVRRPQEDAVLEPLGEEAESGPVPEYDLDQVGPCGPGTRTGGPRTDPAAARPAPAWRARRCPCACRCSPRPDAPSRPEEAGVMTRAPRRRRCTTVHLHR